MKWLWCRGYPIWFANWFCQMDRAFDDFGEGVWEVVYNFFAIIFLFLYLILNTILTPFGDIFKLGTLYRKD